MANFLKGEVPLVLSDKRAFTLVFDMDGLIEAEAAYGKPLPHLLADGQKGFMGAIRALLFGAMRAQHPEVTRSDVSDILATDLQQVTVALSNAVDRSMPDPAKEGDGGKAPVAASPRGNTSGASGAKRSSTRKRSGG